MIPPDDPDLIQFFRAIAAGDNTVVSHLVETRPALLHARDASGQTALHAAADANDPAMGELFLSHGADPEALLGASNHTVMSWAVTCNAMEFAAMLVRLGVTPDLFCAAGIGSTGAVRGWFDADGQLKSGASRTGSTRYAHGSRLPCPPPLAVEQVSDALYLASRNGQVDVVRELLTHAPDLTFRAYMGATALHWAYFSGSRPTIDLLLAAGADPDSRDESLGCLPHVFGICTTANWGFTFLVQKLLRGDPSLATVTDGRTSPLHEAARNGRAGIVSLLLEHGADAHAPNHAGQTAIDVARSAGHLDVASALLAAPRGPRG